MAKILKQAVFDVRSFYIQKLKDSGYSFDTKTLATYTITELKKEYALTLKNGGCNKKSEQTKS
ncbi:Fur-regulated basic protein FbpA [Bacillus tianshenii]|uniref:Fur-regulated basic protein FbpA n=1 Tax=Sutcliffiella tianshenii TaxID=1463404 RepID=UPI001CD66AEE|nr:Fur-regulated basic protein FbpA [Bacillus tianshenii]MCA1321107.1 Fur-regulated basic protein FbpA [Bacillus tianshenii]